MTKAKIKLGVKFLILIGMACFIFPFATVSCSSISYDFNGFELMTSITFKEDIQSSNSSLYPNFFLIGAFVFGALGTFLGWKAVADGEEGSRGGAIFTAIATVCMILFPMTFGTYYDLDDMVTVEFQPGYFISLIAYIGGTASSIALFNGAGSDDEPENTGLPQGTPSYQQAPTPPGNGVTGPGPSPAPPVSVSVQILSDGTQQTISLRHFPSYIGTDRSFCQILVADPAISSIHAQIFLKDQDVYIQDLESRTGTLLNGAPLTVPTEILSGDEVTVGSSKLRFIVSLGSVY